MLSTSTRLRLNKILERIANDLPVSLSERVYLHKYADRDQTVASWLHKARRLQQNKKPEDGIDQLLGDLELGSVDPERAYKPEEDDLSDWFRGAPSWLGRS